MSNQQQLAVRQESPLAFSTQASVMTLADKMRYCDILSKANMLPSNYAGNPGNVLVALELGNALGIEPIVTMMELYVVNNRPSMSAKLMNALVRRAGHKLTVDVDDTQATCEIVRKDDLGTVYRFQFTYKDAENAKLTGKDTWKFYKKAMLSSRAIAGCSRIACPELLLGMLTPEELGDDNKVEKLGDTPNAAQVVPAPGAQEPGYNKIAAPAPTRRKAKKDEAAAEDSAATMFPDATEAEVTEAPGDKSAPKLTEQQAAAAEIRMKELWANINSVFGAKADTDGVKFATDTCQRLGIPINDKGPQLGTIPNSKFDELIFTVVDYGESLQQNDGFGT